MPFFEIASLTLTDFCNSAIFSDVSIFASPPLDTDTVLPSGKLKKFFIKY